MGETEGVRGGGERGKGVLKGEEQKGGNGNGLVKRRTHHRLGRKKHLTRVGKRRSDGQVWKGGGPGEKSEAESRQQRGKRRHKV